MINAAMDVSVNALWDVVYVNELDSHTLDEMISLNLYEQIRAAGSDVVISASQLTINITVAQAVQLQRGLDAAIKNAESLAMQEAERLSNSKLPPQLVSTPVTLGDVSDKDS